MDGWTARLPFLPRTKATAHLLCDQQGDRTQHVRPRHNVDCNIDDGVHNFRGAVGSDVSIPAGHMPGRNRSVSAEATAQHVEMAYPA